MICTERFFSCLVRLFSETTLGFAIALALSLSLACKKKLTCYIPVISALFSTLTFYTLSSTHSQTERKHCVKRRNCSSRAISPIPKCFHKACFPGASKDVIVWEWVNILSKPLAAFPHHHCRNNRQW